MLYLVAASPGAYFLSRKIALYVPLPKAIGGV